MGASISSIRPRASLIGDRCRQRFLFLLSSSVFKRLIIFSSSRFFFIFFYCFQLSIFFFLFASHTLSFHASCFSALTLSRTSFVANSLSFYLCAFCVLPPCFMYIKRTQKSILYSAALSVCCLFILCANATSRV